MNFELAIAVKTVVVVACSGCVAFLLRRASAESRHRMWAAGLWAALALPTMSATLPGIEIRVLPPVFAAARSETSPLDSVELPVVVPTSLAAAGSSAITNSPAIAQEAIDPVAVLPSGAPAGNTMPIPENLRREMPFSILWPTFVWGLGALVVIVRVAFGFVEISRLRRMSTPSVDAEWRDLLEDLQLRMAVRIPVELRTAAGKAPPMTWGLFRHVILIPDDAHSWTKDRQGMVLAHELAHIKRNDGLTQILSHICCSIHWFNPLVWYAAYRLRIERERACDAAVLSLGADAGDYADHLLHIARAVNSGHGFATVSMAQPSQLEKRIQAILEFGGPGVRRPSMSGLSSGVLLSTLGLLTIAVATIQLTALAPLAAAAPPPVVLRQSITAPLKVASPPFQEIAASVPRNFLQPPFYSAMLQVSGGRGGGQPAVSLDVSAAVAVDPETTITGVIRGVVRDGTDGRPIENAMVTVVRSANAITPNSTPSYSAATDSGGRFLFSGVPVGEYRLTAAHPEFAWPGPRSVPNVPSIRITVPPGEDGRDINVGLLRTSAIFGRVSDSGGRPLSALPLALFHVEYDVQGAPTLVAGSTSASGGLTDENGEYRIFNVPPGRYYIAAISRTPALGATSGPIFYPGTLAFERAVEIAVPPNAEVGPMNFLFDPGEDYSITFRIAGGTLTGAAAFQLRPRAGTLLPPIFGPRQLEADADGRYTIHDIPPGSYDLYIASSTPPFAGVRRFEVNITHEDVDLGRLTLTSGTTINGKVSFRDTPPVDLLSIRLTPVHMLNGRGQGAVPVAGRFVFEQTSPGRYTVAVPSLPAENYIAAVLYGGRDVLGTALEIDGEIQGELEVIIGGMPGKVEGMLLDAMDSPVSGNTVVLAPDGSRNPSRLLTSTTDQNGMFHFTAPPGDYRLFAWEVVAGNAFRNPDFLAQFQARAVRVRVDRGSIVRSTVRIIPESR